MHEQEGPARTFDELGDLVAIGNEARTRIGSVDPALTSRWSALTSDNWSVRRIVLMTRGLLSSGPR
jgi:hypothetical protein